MVWNLIIIGGMAILTGIGFLILFKIEDMREKKKDARQER